MSFGDGIANVMVDREEKYGKFVAWLMLGRDFLICGAVVGVFLALFCGTMETLADWSEGHDTLLHVAEHNLSKLWELLGRIV